MQQYDARTRARGFVDAMHDDAVEGRRDLTCAIFNVSRLAASAASAATWRGATITGLRCAAVAARRGAPVAG